MRIGKRFFRSVLPAMLSFLFSSVYSMVDGFFIGRNVGDTGLAAVNLAFPLSAFILAAGTGIGMGGAVLCAISRGEKDKNREMQYLGNTIALLLFAWLLFVALLSLLGRPVLALLGAQDEVLEEAVRYLQILTAGAVFQLFATGLTPLLRNQDASLLAMAAMISGFGANILLDFFFVPRFGLSGAAWATVSGQAVALLPCVYFFVRKMRGQYRKLFFLRARQSVQILRVGLSPFGLILAPCAVMMLMNRFAASYGGSEAVAAYAVISYVYSVILYLLQGIGDGSQPLIGVFYGMGNPAGTKKVRNMAYGLAAGTALVFLTAVLAFCPALPAFFGASPQAAALAARALPWYAVSALFAAFSRMTSSYFTSIKRNASASVLVYGEPVLLFLLLVLLFPALWGLDGVWAAGPASQVVLFLASLLLLFWHRLHPAPSPCSRISVKAIPQEKARPL